MRRWSATSNRYASFLPGPMAMQCRFGIGRASQLANKLDEALAAYRQVAEDGGPLADDATLQMAIVQHRQKEYRAAEETLSEFDAKHRASELRPVALFWRGPGTAFRRPGHRGGPIAAGGD